MINVSPEGVKWGVALVVFFVLLWSVVSGFIAGRDLARAKATVLGVQSLQKGLEYFYSDQSRFPSQLEFEDGEKLSIYLQNFPGLSFTHKKWCKSEARYLSSGGATFEYSYCLPRKWKDWSRGWHSFDERNFK